MEQKLDAFFDAIIAGGGIVGCGAAIRLAERGWRVLLIERHRALPKHLAGELFHPPGVDQLAHLGVLPQLLEASGQPVEGFAVFRSADAEPIVLKYEEIPGGSPRGMGLHHGEIVSALRARAAAHDNVTFHNARVCDAIWRGDRVVGVELREQHGARRSVYGRLVLAADGRHSRLRESLGIEATKTFISFSVAFTLRDMRLPVPRHGNVILGLPAPALAYPIADGTVRMLFDVPAEQGTKLSVLVARVREDYLPALPAGLRRELGLAIDRGDVMLAPNHWIATQRCTLPGAALLGDAAGCNHPLTASGMTSALHDVAVLDAALDLSDDLDEALVLYARGHYRYARAREILARALYESFVGDRPGTQAICEGIFDYWTRSPSGRALSLGLLSGSASQPMLFVKEYLHVARMSVASALFGHGTFQGVRQRTEAIAGVATESMNKVGWLLSLLDSSGRGAASSRKIGWLLDLFTAQNIRVRARIEDGARIARGRLVSPRRRRA